MNGNDEKLPLIASSFPNSEQYLHSQKRYSGGRINHHLRIKQEETKEADEYGNFTANSSMRQNNGDIIDERYSNELSSLIMSDIRVFSQDNRDSSRNSNSPLPFHENNLLSHCHLKEEDVIENHKARRTLIIACFLCLSSMMAEIVGGYIAGSLAVATDAAHLLTDFASFLISLFSLFMTTRPPTRRMSFGWHRAEVLGAFVSVVFIWIITGVLVYLAILRIIKQSYDIKAGPMLITATIGVFVNVIMGVLLHQAGHHGHSHGGGNGRSKKNHTTNASNQYQQFNNSDDDASHDPLIDDTVSVENGLMAAGQNNVQNSNNSDVVAIKDRPLRKRRQNINIRAAFIHVLGDFFQSVGVLIAAYIIYYHPELAIMDPICTFIFSGLVLLTTVAIMRDALNVLMEGSPKGIDFLEVAETLSSIKGVVRVHNLRLWSLTMDKVALSAHLAVNDNYDSQDILKSAMRTMRTKFGVFECTIQIEHYSNDMDDCVKCKHPKG